MKRAGLPPIHNSRCADNRPVRWVNGDEVVEMAFDRMGRRVAKNNQRFVYDGYLCIKGIENTATIHYSLSPIHCFVWDPTEKVATRPLVWNRNGELSFYTHDGNKNVSEVIASNGTLAAHYECAPFGAITVKSGEYAEENPWRFSSEYADDILGLVYYNYRHYEPANGRWLSRDPIEEEGGLGLYGWCENLSWSYFDYLGLEGRYGIVGPKTEVGTNKIWIGVWSEDYHMIRRKIIYDYCICESKEKVNQTFESISSSYYDLGMGSENFPAFWYEAINIEVPDVKGTITVEIQLLTGGVGPLTPPTDEEKEEERKRIPENGGTGGAFGTAGGDVAHGVNNYPVPPGSTPSGPSYKVVIGFKCYDKDKDDTAPTIKSKETGDGDNWEENISRHGRTEYPSILAESK